MSKSVQVDPGWGNRWFGILSVVLGLALIFWGMGASHLATPSDPSASVLLNSSLSLFWVFLALTLLFFVVALVSRYSDSEKANIITLAAEWATIVSLVVAIFAFWNDLRGKHSNDSPITLYVGPPCQNCEPIPPGGAAPSTITFLDTPSPLPAFRSGEANEPQPAPFNDEYCAEASKLVDKGATILLLLARHDQSELRSAAKKKYSSNFGLAGQRAKVIEDLLMSGCRGMKGAKVISTALPPQNVGPNLSAAQLQDDRRVRLLGFKLQPGEEIK